MKHYSKILFLAAAFTGLVSCAVNEVKEFPVDKPANLEEYEYLKDYDVLKNYVDRSANANFKLGAGVDAGAFVQHGQDYLMAVSNFDEVTPLNAMKHANVVGNNGKMNVDAIVSFVDDANNTGLSVYGQPLAWHAQQNTKFLNTLIADKVDPDWVPELVEQIVYKDRTCLLVESADMVEQAWDSQLWIAAQTPFKEGDSWEISMDLYALNEAAPGTQIHGDPGAYMHWAAIGNPTFKTEWSNWTAKGTIPAEGNGGRTIAFNLNDFQKANKWYLDNVSFKINGVEQIVNGSFDDPDVNENFYSKEYAKDKQAINKATIVDKYEQKIMVEVPRTQEVNRTCIVVESQDMVSAAWDTQFWIYFPSSPMKEGDSWEVSMDVRADKEASASTQTHKGPGGYIHWACIGNVNFTTEWNTYTAKGTASTEMNGGDAIAFNLNDFANANKYYFDNISFKINGVEVIVNGNCDDPDGTANFVAKEYPAGSGSAARIVQSYTIELPGGRTPQTPEEKKDTLTTAMDNWINGMMTATAGKVKAWDAVRDVLAEKVDDEANFYWQDYLGEDDYVKMVFSKARAYYAAAGGNASDLKLFISEGGLTDSQKLATLLSKIEAWEAAEGVQIDGIAVQLHVTCVCDKTTEEQAEPIVAMFTALKDSDKLVKISEFDMTVVASEGGSPIASANVTEEQHQKMAELYSYIVSKYLEILPDGYGITQWTTSDTAQNPLGLWDVNYGRKHAYAGFADGLGGTPSAE